MTVLLTGAAGFIGYHVAKALIDRGDKVYGFDSINDYYDPSLKHYRLAQLAHSSNFSFMQGDLADKRAVRDAWEIARPRVVIHLAAQAGVRYSLQNPDAYIQSNIVGFQHVIDLVRETQPINFVYASSSSVYGGTRQLPFSEDLRLDSPISLYAATKISNELVATTYGRLFGIPSTGLRFFTVYGPLSRPDMAMFKFADLMWARRSIPVYNSGKMLRDFTYIDDIVRGVLAAVDRPEINRIYNLGKGVPDSLTDMIGYLEEGLGIKANMELLPMQAGDLDATLADISRAKADLGYAPTITLAAGVAAFCDWYLRYRS